MISIEVDLLNNFFSLKHVLVHAPQAYLSILYMRLPSCFRIILRGQVVEHHSIPSDLKFPEFIIYRPQLCGSKEVCVVYLKSLPPATNCIL